MADASRYYLERSLDEIKDLEEKNLFTKNELRIILRKRSQFERSIAGTLKNSFDFQKYAEYEKSVEQLRRKRFHRLGLAKTAYKQGPSDTAGPRRILFIYDRATSRFPSNIPLWLQYLEYAKETKAFHVITKIFNDMLRLHPTNTQLWILAASHEVDFNSSISTARHVMQRCLRFNWDDPVAWIEYIKLELIYIAKVLTRRQLLGLVTPEQQRQDEEEEDDNNKNVLVLPEFDGDEIKEELKRLPEADMSMLGDVDSNPALRGDVALTIFDAALSSLSDKVELCTQVLAIIDEFTNLKREYLANHVLEKLIVEKPTAEYKVAKAMLPIRYTEPNTAEFVDGLKVVVKQFRTLLKSNAEESAQLKAAFRDATAKYLEDESLEDNLRLVITKVSS